jgi:hypothetical protein
MTDWPNQTALDYLQWGTIMLAIRNMIIILQLRNSLPFMEPEGSLLCLQDPANGSYPESDASSQQLLTLFP